MIIILLTQLFSGPFWVKRNKKFRTISQYAAKLKYQNMHVVFCLKVSTETILFTHSNMYYVLFVCGFNLILHIILIYIWCENMCIYIYIIYIWLYSYIYIYIYGVKICVYIYIYIYVYNIYSYIYIYIYSYIYIYIYIQLLQLYIQLYTTKTEGVRIKYKECSILTKQSRIQNKRNTRHVKFIILRILHGGAKIWILSSSDENNILRISVVNE